MDGREKKGAHANRQHLKNKKKINSFKALKVSIVDIRLHDGCHMSRFSQECPDIFWHCSDLEFGWATQIDHHNLAASGEVNTKYWSLMGASAPHS